MFEFSKLPNSIIYKTGEESLLRKYEDNKVAVIVDTLYYYIDRRDICKFSLEELITDCGYKCSSKKGETNDKFKRVLSNLQSDGYITCSRDLATIKLKEVVKCKIVHLPDNYFELHSKDRDKIMSYNSQKIDNVSLLNLYCEYSARMYKRSKDSQPLYANGGLAEVCYPTMKDIKQDTTIGESVIKKYNDILVELDLIVIGNAGLYYFDKDKDKTVRESCNIYAFAGKDSKVNIKEGIKMNKLFGESQGRIYINSRDYKNNNKQLNGEKGSLLKKEKLGTITEDESIRLLEISKSLKGDVEKVDVLAELGYREFEDEFEDADLSPEEEARLLFG